MKALVTALSKILPIYPFEAPQSARVPYGIYVKSESPVRTKDGIVGYDGSVTISIYANTLEAVGRIAEQIISVLDNTTLDGYSYYYESANEENYSDIGLISKELIFTTLR